MIFDCANLCKRTALGKRTNIESGNTDNTHCMHVPVPQQVSHYETDGKKWTRNNCKTYILSVKKRVMAGVFPPAAAVPAQGSPVAGACCAGVSKAWKQANATDAPVHDCLAAGRTFRMLGLRTEPRKAANGRPKGRKTQRKRPSFSV